MKTQWLKNWLLNNNENLVLLDEAVVYGSLKASTFMLRLFCLIYFCTNYYNFVVIDICSKK